MIHLTLCLLARALTLLIILHLLSPSGAGSLIDLAFTSCQSSLCGCSTIPFLGNSDHYGIELSLKWKFLNLSKTHLRTLWRYDHANFETAKELLETVDLESLIADDTDVAWQNGVTEFMSIMDQCVPKTATPTKWNLPWLSKELTKSIHTRNLAYKCAKRTGTAAFPFL